MVQTILLRKSICSKETQSFLCFVRRQAPGRCYKRISDGFDRKCMRCIREFHFFELQVSALLYSPNRQMNSGCVEN